MNLQKETLDKAYVIRKNLNIKGTQNNRKISMKLKDRFKKCKYIMGLSN